MLRHGVFSGKGAIEPGLETTQTGSRDRCFVWLRKRVVCFGRGIECLWAVPPPPKGLQVKKSNRLLALRLQQNDFLRECLGWAWRVVGALTWISSDVPDFFRNLDDGSKVFCCFFIVVDDH